MAAVALLTIMSPRLQSHLGGDVEKPVGVVWFLMGSSGGGDFQIVMEFHQIVIICLFA